MSINCNMMKERKNHETLANFDRLRLANCADLDRFRLNFDCKFTCLSLALSIYALTVSISVWRICSHRNAFSFLMLGFIIDTYVSFDSIKAIEIEDADDDSADEK